MSTDKNNIDNITIDLGGYDSWGAGQGGGGGATGSSFTSGAGQSYTDSIYTGSSIDTITLDPSIYSINSSITSPSSITWTQDYSTTAGVWGNTDATVQIDTDGVNIKEGGDIKIGGKSLSEAIEKIEERLGILNPNPELEDRWDKLKELRKQYMELEKDLLEKEKIMKILKEQ